MHKMGLTSTRMCDKLCSDQIMIQEPHQVWYTYVMRGLAVVIFVNWKAHHGPGMSNLRESVGKKRIYPYPPYVIAAGML